MECEGRFSSKQGILATWPRDWNESRDNFQARLYFLSCSALAVVTLQLPACFTRVSLWRFCQSKPVVRSSRETPLSAHILSFFTLSHTQPLHYSHLNTRFLHAELQANLAWNKANTWLIKFNLIIFICITCLYNELIIKDMNQFFK